MTKKIRKEENINECLNNGSILLNNPLTVFGVITKLDNEKGCGMIEDSDGRVFLFPFTNIISGASSLEQGMEVLFTDEGKIKGKKYYSANYIHRNGTLEELTALAKSIARINACSFRKVCDHIIDVYPEAIEDVNNIILTKRDSNKTEISEANTYFEKKEYKSAIESYKKILIQGAKTKDCIHKISDCYFALYEEEKNERSKHAIAKKLLLFIKNNYAKLDLEDSLNFRINIYTKLGKTDLLIKTIDDALQQTDIMSDFRASLLCKKASFLKKKDPRCDVRDIIFEALYLNPFDKEAEIIAFPEFKNQNDRQTGFRSYKTNTLSFSELILSIKSFELTSKEKSKKKTDKARYINKLRSLDKRSSELPDQLIRTAVAFYNSSSVNSYKISSLLSEYYSIRAEQLAKLGNKHFISAFFLWKEAFRLIRGTGFFVQWQTATILSVLTGISIIKDPSLKTFSPWQNRKTWQEIMKNGVLSPEYWPLFLLVVYENEPLFNDVLSLIKSNGKLMTSIVSCFNTNGVPISYSDYAKPDVLKDKVKQLVQYYLTNDIKAQESFKPLRRKGLQLRKHYLILSDIFKCDIIPNNISAQNKKYLIDLEQTIMPRLGSYLEEKESASKLEQGNFLNKEIKGLYDNVIDYPTFFSGTTILNECLSLSKLVSYDLKIAETISTPNLNAWPKDYNALIDENGNCHIHVMISNSTGSATAYISKVSLISDELQNDNTRISKIMLKGGDEEEFTFTLKIKKEYYNANTLSFDLIITYKTRKSKLKITDKIGLQDIHINRPEQIFTPIIGSIYKYGSSISFDDPTFVGRDENIKELLNYVLHPYDEGPQIIVYGQKRCGKTSLVKAVRVKLKKDYPDKAWCVFHTLAINDEEEDNADDDELNNNENNNVVFSEGDFYYQLLDAIDSTLNSEETPKPKIILPIESEMVNSKFPVRYFIQTIAQFKRSMKETPGWENRRLILIIDEFTRLYGCIKRRHASKEILHHWKGIQESTDSQFATIFVGHDIVQAFFKEPYVKNAGDIIERYPLGYLNKYESKKLIEGPIWDKKNNQSRFTIEAISQIYYYTAGSPSYIQQFMKEMVKYINNNRIIKVSKNDVNSVATCFINKENSAFRTIESFDNLINSGIDSAYNIFTDKEIELVLRMIANASQSTEYCNRSELNKENVFDKERLELILKDLYMRNVIERRDNDKLIKIKVGLFKEWLIKN